MTIADMHTKPLCNIRVNYDIVNMYVCLCILACNTVTQTCSNNVFVEMNVFRLYVNCAPYPYAVGKPR